MNARVAIPQKLLARFSVAVIWILGLGILTLGGVDVVAER